MYTAIITFMIVQSDEVDMSEFAKKSANTSPWFVVHDSKFFIIVECSILCQATSFVDALFLLLSCYYVFHLSYQAKTKKILLFLQDYILGRPDNHESRVASYLAISADINKCIQ